MGKKPKKASAGSLADLHQSEDTWEIDVRQMAATIRSGEAAVRPWLVIVLNATSGVVLAFELSEEKPGRDAVEEVVECALREPAEGDPQRPALVRLADAQLARHLKPFLTNAGIEAEVVDTLERVDDVLQELNEQLPTMSMPSSPGLLEMPGITPEVVGSFFDAAAVYFEAAPWKKVGERTIRVACSRFDSGPWYAIMMGHAGMTRGLVMYDSLETLQRIQEGGLSEMENARLTSALTVQFGPRDDLLPMDAEAAERHGWRVAGPDAYPSVFRMNPGLSIRPPLVWELELLEGCLRALPEFVRKKTRRLAPLALTVPVSSGDLPLELAWED